MLMMMMAPPSVTNLGIELISQLNTVYTPVIYVGQNPDKLYYTRIDKCFLLLPDNTNSSSIAH